MLVVMLHPLHSAVLFVRLSVFVPVAPNRPREPPVSAKTEPPEVLTRKPLLMLRVLVLVSENRLPVTFRKLPPATLNSDPLFTVNVLAFSLISASPGSRLTFILAFWAR